MNMVYDNVKQMGHRQTVVRRGLSRLMRISALGVGLAMDGCIDSPASAQTSGLANNAYQRLAEANPDLPGFLYYGVTGADRGLGYNGSFMTFGGFIPYGEDGMGGVWNADLRSHLSAYGGFFSNVGLVRKQFIGGMVGGIGVYWDFDGDQNQYVDLANPTGLPDFNMAEQFGQSFNQVGVSGELLTDWGNGRVNGYLPTDADGVVRGTTSEPFYGNFLLAQTGFYGALTGVDGEVGVYVPGLSDWAGMWSVGGYCYGAPNMGLSIPERASSFGGVYTRIDMTFAQNWDFQIQANNDSVFDWTGFATLTYRMGGSRRRNVPDQMEQPMQRNAHIVRYSRNPVAATNSVTGNLWHVTHVNNQAGDGGDGTDAAPFNRLADSTTPLAAANSAVDAAGLVKLPPGINTQDSILYVRRGTGTSLNYDVRPTSILLQPGQRMLGEGVAHSVFTAQNGILPFGGDGGQVPVLTSSAGVAPVSLDGDGALLSGFRIQDSLTGVAVTANVNGGTGIGAAEVNRTAIFNAGVGIQVDDVSGAVRVRDVAIDRSGIGVLVQDTGTGLLTGDIRFTDTVIENSVAHSFVVGSPFVPNSGGAATIDFRGRMAQTGGAEIINVVNTTGGVIRIGTGAAAGNVANSITQTGGNGIKVTDTDGDVAIAGFQLRGGQALTPGDGVVNVSGGAGTTLLANGEVVDGFGPGVRIVDKPLNAVTGQGGAILQTTRITDMNDDTRPGGELGIGILVTTDATDTNVLLSRNTVSNQASEDAAAIRILGNAGNTIAATLVENAARGNQSGTFVAGSTINRAFVIETNGGIVNLNAPQNEFRDLQFVNPAPPPPGIISVAMRFDVTGGALNITQVSESDLQSRNGGLSIINGGATFGAPAPPVPTAP